MSTLALSTRDAFAPQRPPGMAPGLVLALIAHVLLVLALAWSVNWKTSEPEGVVAELWSALPQIAAPRVSLPEPRPPVVERRPLVVEPRPAPPVVRPQPVTPPREEAQIAVERAAAARKVEAAKREEARKIEAERERERERLADAQAEKKKLAEKARQDEAREAASREAYLRRMMKQAGTSTDPAVAGDSARTSGPSASYQGLIEATIRPKIETPGAVAGNPRAVVEVRVALDGTITGFRLVTSSGSAIWDERVLAGIEKTKVLPRDTGGRVYSPMEIGFRPQR